ncbi:MAG: AmmeMemoRadiSam system radical SAM enzyme [Proteobacteria bacterium]|nr:AmmeMemoRadiSam system radical SAM enzyme [Pseudomonadota bacterium]
MNEKTLLTRRSFVTCSFAAISSCALAGPFALSALALPAQDIHGQIFKNDAPDKLWKWSHEGFLYRKLAGDKVMCGICPNHCILDKGDRSVCRSKVNMNGKLYTLAYGNPCSLNVDPVEKKPLFHFKPGTRVFSLATTGCNFRCLNCQNWEISQARPEDVRHYDLFPDGVVKEAISSQTQSIAYTYSEATTYFEYMIDIARLAKENGLFNLYISNGYINQEPLLELVKVLDGANINLKSFSDDVYRKLNGGRLNPVLETFKTLHEKKVHFEITNLVVPGYNDNEKLVNAMCDWILENLGPDHPLHFLRFFPQYKLDRLAPTPVSTLDTFRDIAMKKGLHYVYLGNVPNHEGNHTCCHQCGKRIVERKGYYISRFDITSGACSYCKTVIPGVW